MSSLITASDLRPFVTKIELDSSVQAVLTALGTNGVRVLPETTTLNLVKFNKRERALSNPSFEITNGIVVLSGVDYEAHRDSFEQFEGENLVVRHGKFAYGLVSVEANTILPVVGRATVVYDLVAEVSHSTCDYTRASVELLGISSKTYSEFFNINGEPHLLVSTVKSATSHENWDKGGGTFCFNTKRKEPITFNLKYRRRYMVTPTGQPNLFRLVFHSIVQRHAQQNNSGTPLLTISGNLDRKKVMSHRVK